jgi:hypothetical protein
MGAIRPPKRAKLLVGLLSGDPDLMRLARQRLAKRFGDVNFETELWPFTATDYYRAELGDEIQRQFVFFHELVSVEQLAHIKRETNALEERICEDTARPPTMRPVNIDPGYITLSKLVLASTKDHAHRIYVGGGIYAEVTLRFESGGWKAWPWTYPDYAAETYHSAFTRAREALKTQLTKAE